MPSLRSLARTSTVAALVTIPNLGAATPVKERLRVLDDDVPPPATETSGALPSTAAGDTTWIADWSFDGPGGCDASGWTHADHRILNDGTNYWSIGTSYSGIGGISSKAAVLAKHDLTWASDGYGSDWDYSIILEYQGASTLTFDYLSDGEPCCDFVTVETDSAGASESLVNYAVGPGGDPASFRDVVFTTSGPHNATAGPIALSDYGVPAVTHEVYIRFHSNDGWDDSDGDYLSYWNAGLVVDDIVVDGAPAGAGGYDYSENFEGVLNANVTLANTAPAVPFGDWARLYQHPTDNDNRSCSEDPTCAWIFSDPGLPAYQPDMAFGPGGAVVRNWLDVVLLSPWVSLAGTFGPNTSTTLSFRLFGGNTYSLGRIRGSWSVRALVKVDNTDTPAPGDSVLLYTSWRHPEWFGVGFFQWTTGIGDLTPYLAGATEMQVRFRVADWQLKNIAGAAPPTTLDPGPGPYFDRVRIGRNVVPVPTAPQFCDDCGIAFGLPQDTFPTALYVPPCTIAPSVLYRATTERFGTCAFAPAISWFGLPFPVAPACMALCDLVGVQDAQIVDPGAGIADVSFYGAIVAGPHAGKAPPPWTVGANGFFRVPLVHGWSECNWGGPGWFFDLDDEYFRGGDVLYYVLTATDGAGGTGSYPSGLQAAPASVAQAEAATGGLAEVSFLPVIDWDPGYLARIAAHPSGKLDPTPDEIANSSQRSCILYVNQTVDLPRSGPANRTAFLRTLDHLGYRDLCDVYDMNDYGRSVTNNQLAGRATVEQATGYALIVHDAGRHASHTTVPEGGGQEGLWPQTQWYRDYLARAPSSLAGRATLWLLGDDILESTYLPNPLLSIDMGVTLAATSQPSRPNVVGQTSFTWADGSSTDFTGDLFGLSGRPPSFGDCPGYYYDGLGASGPAVVTHRYVLGGVDGTGAAVANANPAQDWNTLLMSFSWGDILDAQGSAPGTPREDLAASILNAVLPASCRAQASPTDVAQDGRLPLAARLYANVPNPFNPTTTIAFDLPQRGNVRLRIFDVAGRTVRTLVDGPMDGGRRRVLWNGLDEAGRPAASGLYLYRLESPGFAATRKMLLVR